MANQDNLDNKLMAVFLIVEDVIYRAKMDGTNTGVLYLGDSGAPVSTPADAEDVQRNLLKEYLDLTTGETDLKVEGDIPPNGAPWAAVVDVTLDNGTSRLWVERNFQRVGDPVSDEADSAHLVFSNDNPQDMLAGTPGLSQIRSYAGPSSARVFATGNDATLIGTSARDYGAARDLDN